MESDRWCGPGVCASHSHEGKKMVVIFDIDDCLMPWAEKVHQACSAQGINPENKLWTQWYMWKDYGCTQEQWLEVVNSLAVPGGIYHAELYLGASEAISKLESAGHEIHLVTARGFFDHGEKIRQWTREWIEFNHIPGALWFSRDKGSVAREIGATHGIDDRIENIRSLQNAGVDAYLMSQPHNIGLIFDESRRVDNVSEFVDRIMT